MGEPAKKPLYRNPWLWVGVGVVVVGLAVGLGIGLTRDDPGPKPAVNSSSPWRQGAATGLPVAASQRRVLLFRCAATTVLPSAANCAARTKPV